MNKTATTVTLLHSATFTLFFILSTVMNYFVYPLLTSEGTSAFLKGFLETVISAFLYAVLFFIVKLVYKVIFFKILNKNLNLGGTWYHVMIKKNLHGLIKTDKLRAGETMIKQNLYDLYFTADNAYYFLSEDGTPTSERNSTNHTHWTLKISDWEGDGKLLGCYRADTSTKGAITSCPYCGAPFAEKKSVEKEERIGIHNLEIISDNYIKGRFADEYPSASFGEIYFFRKREERDKLIADFLADGSIDGEYN